MLIRPALLAPLLGLLALSAAGATALAQRPAEPRSQPARTAAPSPTGAAQARGPRAAAGRFTAEDAQAVRVLIHGYFRAFTEQDWAHFDRYMTAPFMLMGPRPRILPTYEEVLRTWQQIRAPLAHTAYAASKAVHVQVTGLTADSALAEVYWQRVTRSGAVMSDGAEYYCAVRRDGRWRLNGHIDQQLALYRGPR